MPPTPFTTTSEELSGGVYALGVRGELDMSTAPELERLLDSVPSGPEASLILDLTECEFIDSTGIALIVRAWQRIDRDAGAEGEGKMALCCANHQVRRLLDITGVGSSIALHADRETALAELRD